MVEDVVRQLVDLLQALPQCRAMEAVGIAALGDFLQGATGNPDPLARVLDALDREEHDVAREVAQPASGQRVVADIGDTLRRQQLPEQRDDPFAHHIRHPGIDAVDDDVVEGSDLLADRKDIALLEGEIGQAELRGIGAGLPDRVTAEIDAEEAAAGILRRHRDHVAAAPAAQFEHAHSTRQGRVHAVEMGDGRQPRGMGLREGMAGIGHRIIGIDGWIARHRRPRPAPSPAFQPKHRPGASFI